MPTVEASVEIARPIGEVFDFLINPENLAVWDASVVRAAQVGSGPIAVGSRTDGTNKVLGKNFDWTTEITELDPPNRVTYTSVAGRLQFVVTNSLEATPGGTRFTYHVEAESGLGGVFGRIADPLIVSAQNRTAQANLETLAELLTVGAPA